MTDKAPLPSDDDLPPEEAKLFLSYSRKDRERAQGIADALRQRHFGVFKDTDDILPTEEWRERLEQLIEEADTIVFLLSPHSAASQVCAWEVEYATSLNKRIAPIVIEDVEGDKIPPLLARLNFIFCTPRDPFQNAVDTLISALNTDIDWIREHTRLQGLAKRWKKAGSSDRLLLRGQDIADAEGWRDARPKDSPDVTPMQAQFIAQSRRAAARRQRNWIIGSLAATGLTAMLAVFAWFQSVEADRQRAEAELQRAEAETQRQIAVENAAEAERQRNAAEAERAVASRRLIAQNLRAFEFAQAAQNIQEFLSDLPQINTILAGLESAQTLLSSLEPGAPVVLNGLLYINADDAGLRPVDSQFPAEYWLSLRDKTALVSGSGAVQRLDADGQPDGVSPTIPPFSPCFANATADGISIYGGTSFGYSACSVAMREVRVPSGSGPITETSFRACQDNFIELGGPGATPIPVETLIDQCLGEEALRDMLSGGVSLGANQRALNPLRSLAFPNARSAETLWSGQSDQMAIITAQIARLRSYPLANPNLFFGIENFEGASVGRLVGFDDLSDADMVAIRGIENYGGTGGETHLLCTGQPGRPVECFVFFSTSDFNGVVRDKTQLRVAIFGETLQDEFGNSDQSSLWIVDTPGATPRPVPGLLQYGRILDADFGPDGRIAAVTPSALLLIDPDTDNVRPRPLPKGVRAIHWLGDGSLVLLSETGVFRGDPDRAFTLIPVPMPPLNEESQMGREANLWLSTDPGETVAILGYGQVAIPFDLELSAPLMSYGIIPHEGLIDDQSGIRLARGQGGSLVLDISGEIYQTPEYSGANLAEYLDPETLFR